MLYPRSTEDVSSIVKIAARHAIPIVPFSGGTSLEGHFNAPAYTNGKSKPESESLHETKDLKAGYAFSLDFSANMANIVAVNGSLSLFSISFLGYAE